MHFDDKSFISICDHLATNDTELHFIIHQYGYPPFWKRPASFETLIHIILEQQVSLASALAALNKLKEKIFDITPANVLSLSDKELKDCYFSRQKIIYARHLAAEILSGNLNLKELELMDNNLVRTALLKIKGIGNWSVDVYLMMVLQRCDIFPLGDVALIKSVIETKHLPVAVDKEVIKNLSNQWSPYRTIAAFILWHSYLCKRKQHA